MKPVDFTRSNWSRAFAWCSALLLGMLFSEPFLTFGAAPASATSKAGPRTVREQRDKQPSRSQASEPVVIDGVMRSAMGYLRVFARISYENNPVVGQAATDVLQRARALRGDYMDLNLAASARPQSWWTAVLDTGANVHAVNQDTVARFGLKNVGDVISQVSGVDGDGWKGKTWIYGLSLSGSDGHLSEEPSSPFIPVQPNARFSLELKPYQPQRQSGPEGANLIGMPAIRNILIQVETDNATTAMLREPLDMSSSRAFEESLHGIVAGPRVKLLPPAFRPTNEVIRIPLRYVDSTRMASGFFQPAPQQPVTPIVMGVRYTHLGKQSLGNLILDTGSPVTVISRRMAFQLGLVPNASPVYDKPEFEDSFTGINNREVNATGYTVDSIEMLGRDGQIVQWRNVPILVHDVVVKQLDGRVAVADGIIGNNLFLPSTSGEIDEQGLKVRAAPFTRYWIDGPLGEVWLQKPASGSGS